MQYRKFGRLDWEVSVLSLGIMNPPLDPGTPRKIDQAGMIKITRYMIDNGVNYLDLGFPLDMARHESALRILGQCLKDGYRDKVRLALRIPSQMINTKQDAEKYLDARLEWLAVDRIDFLVPAWLDRETWPKIEGLGILEWAEKAIASGKIGGLGFAFRDQYQYLRAIINAFSDWVMAQFRFSFMEADNSPGISGIKLAAASGLGIVAAETLCGGRLTRSFPQSVSAVWAGSTSQRPLYRWGLEWVWNNAEVSTAVVDVSSFRQAEEDIVLAAKARADSLSIQEEIIINNARDAYRRLKALPCTACRSCMPCPAGIDVPRIFELYNEAIMFGDAAIPGRIYRFEGHAVDACTECGSCTRLCGRHIDIPLQIRAADKILKEK
ncbi:MAG: aldo/keto reductase [Dehalococcoidales bacterium]|nr:aldo/keto reductase [Dehalococcoidales bacterium]